MTASTIRAFEYRGRMIYPLIEHKEETGEYCPSCVFAPSSGPRCAAVGLAMPHGAWCSDGSADYIWGEGEKAALQYITERLTT